MQSYIDMIRIFSCEKMQMHLPQNLHWYPWLQNTLKGKIKSLGKNSHYIHNPHEPAELLSHDIILDFNTTVIKSFK